MLLVGFGKEAEFGDKAFAEAVRTALRALSGTRAANVLWCLAQQHPGGAHAGHFVQHQLGTALAFEITQLDEPGYQTLGCYVECLGHTGQALSFKQAHHQTIGLGCQETILARFAPIQGFCAKFHRASFQGLVHHESSYYPRFAAAGPLCC